MRTFALFRLALVALIVAGCGARTGLEAPAARAVDGGPDAGPDADLDAGAGVDAATCGRDRDCNDGLDCTADRCLRGRCVNRPQPDRCPSTTCTIGRCDRVLGCTTEIAPCEDGIECTIGRCTEEAGCEHLPEDGMCPISHRCDVERGCIARALVHDSFALYEVELPRGTTTRLVATGTGFTDIALSPDRRLFGVSRTGLYELRDDSSDVDLLGDSDEWVALDAGPDGRLYAAGETPFVAVIDPRTFETRVAATLPDGFVASGDIAFVEGRMLVTVTETPGADDDDTALAEVDLVSGTARILGRTGEPCIWALAAFGAELYGFTCSGSLLRIDPFSGRSEFVRDLRLRLGGAAAR